MITQSLRLVAAVLALSCLAAPAFADGRNTRQPHEARRVAPLRTPTAAPRTPCPLGTGDRFTTGERPTGQTWNCSGAFVVTDNVASSVQLPDRMETVPPIIHRAGQPDPCGRPCPPAGPAPRAEAAPPVVVHEARVERSSLTIPSDFGTGGVGADIDGGSGYSRAYIVSSGGGHASATATASAYAFAFARASTFSGGHAGGGGCGCR
jgi:hypothetical protein